ncbi:MFS transporter [Nocardia goodfellowii]
MRQDLSVPGAPASAAELRRVLAVLCLTEITSWGILYYAFPVLAGQISAETGWSATALTAAFAAGQLVGAVAGIPVGRWLDRYGPRWVMSAGSVLGVASLTLVASAQHLAWFFAGWLLVGAAKSAVLYQPAFAALTRWHGVRRVRAMTILTLSGGLASTVFAPLTAAIAQRFDWRATYLVLAGLLAVLTIPAHWYGLRLRWPARPIAEPEHDASPARAAGTREFRILTTALAITSFAVAAAVILLVPLLIERGFSTGTAALALGLGGAGQVLSRLGYGTLERHTSVRTRTALILLGIAASTVLLGSLTTATALVGAAVLAGMARGVLTLLKATAVTDRWGTSHYGRLSGLLAAPSIVASALAPFAATAMAGQLGGYSRAFQLLGVCVVIAAALSVATIPRRGG